MKKNDLATMRYSGDLEIVKFYRCSDGCSFQDIRYDEPYESDEVEAWCRLPEPYKAEMESE